MKGTKQRPLGTPTGDKRLGHVFQKTVLKIEQKGCPQREGVVWGAGGDGRRPGEGVSLCMRGHRAQT